MVVESEQLFCGLTGSWTATQRQEQECNMMRTTATEHKGADANDNVW